MALKEEIATFDEPFFFFWTGRYKSLWKSDESYIHIHVNFAYNCREIVNPSKSINGPQRSPQVTD